MRLVEVEPREKVPALACHGECGGDPENPEHQCVAMIQVDSWPITDDARAYRAHRIELRLGLGAAARALGVTIEEAAGIERGRLVPDEPAGWMLLRDLLSTYQPGPAPIPDELL